MPDRLGRKHPHTSYDSLFVAMDRFGLPEITELHGVRLKLNGYHVVVDLGEIDDQMQLSIRIVKNPGPIFLNMDGWEFGYKATDGQCYGCDFDDARNGGER